MKKKEASLFGIIGLGRFGMYRFQKDDRITIIGTTESFQKFEADAKE